jgi:hypothetical protein
LSWATAQAEEQKEQRARWHGKCGKEHNARVKPETGIGESI